MEGLYMNAQNKLKQLLFLILFSFSMHTSNFKQMEPALTLKFYQMIKDMHELFIKHNIPYWVDGGTLLGMVRHKGLIPWDDDLDISLEKKYEQKLLLLKPILQKLNYDMIPYYFGYKIFPIDGTPLRNYKYPYLDVFIMEPIQEKIYYDTKRPYHQYWGKRDNDILFIRKDELYPLIEYQFGRIKVLGPKNPFPFLFALYGDDCLETAYKWYDHKTEMGIAKQKMILTESDKVAAEPTGPLQDRVARLKS